ncbi:MAG: YceI family protein, partial [Planctomycetota bacterium]
MRNSLIATVLSGMVLVPAQAQEYQIDTGHSALIWGVQHLGLGNTYGRFNDFGGTIIYDPDDLATSAVDVTVQIASIDSADAKRDAHLRNADVFDAGTFPTMTFRGEGFRPVAGKENTYAVDGEITLRGISKPLSVEFVKIGQGPQPMMDNRPAVGFQSQFILNRHDFGVGQ